MDKLAGLYTQIQILKKRLNSLDLSKEDPGNVAALSSDLTALEDRYTKISEAKKKRQQEKLSKDAPATTEVTKEALPEALPEVTDKVRCNKCDSVYPQDVKECAKCKTDAYLMQPYVPGKTDKEAKPEPSIADKMTAPAEAPVAAPVVESAEDLEAKKKKKKRCNNCGGHYFPIGFGGHPTTCSHSGPSSDSGDSGGGDAGDFGAGGDMGGGDAGGAGAGAAGGGAAVAAPSKALLQKFSNDDIVEPTKGTPGSWGSVLRHDGGPEDLVYVKWHGGPLKEMHSGYGGYTVSDLKRKASKKADLETDGIPSPMEIAETFVNGNISDAREWVGGSLEKFMAVMDILGYGSEEGRSFQRLMRPSRTAAVAPIEKEEDLEVDATANATIVHNFFNGHTSGQTKNVKIKPVIGGVALINYQTPIVFYSSKGKDPMYFFNTQKYSQTTSKLQNNIRAFTNGLKTKEVDENGIYAAMKMVADAPEEKPRPPHVPGLQDFTPSMPVTDMPEPSANPEETPLQVAHLDTKLTKKAVKVEFVEDEAKKGPSLEGLTKFLNEEFKKMDPKSAVDSMESRIEALCSEWAETNGYKMDADPSKDILRFTQKHLGDVKVADVDPSEKGGVGYGGDRPGSAVAPARDEDVTLEAGNGAHSECEACGKDFIQNDPRGNVPFCQKCVSDLDRKVKRTEQWLKKQQIDRERKQQQEQEFKNQREQYAPKFTDIEDPLNMASALTKVAYVREEDGKWYVYSKKGKRLSKGYGSKDEANKRLREIEYFKHQGSMKLSSRDITAEAPPLATEITQQVQKIRERMTTFQEGLKTQASAGSDEAFKLLKLDIESLRQRYATDPEAMKALDAIVYEMEQLTHTPEAPTAAVEKAATVPPKPTQDPGLGMTYWFNKATQTWEITNKTV